MKLEKIFGQLLKQHRMEFGLSQEELAFQAELDRTFISLLENGKRQPTLNTIFSLCEALHLKPSEILKEVEDAFNKR
ncbi:helix-turn-helix domain-containing protein [Paenibacillus albus]|uniref:XRE family transcriptional regulator n=1 Tax=Paenibacillus albus TaxID=2495582 RepID=A0A3Q8X3F9_9BACL|nr:helix-turn-helix transcriptional regulator [Paenibacillus albus]AZN39544.1 XRE family transcriptional regulator [Paenibacillus albus]